MSVRLTAAWRCYKITACHMCMVERFYPRLRKCAFMAGVLLQEAIYQLLRLAGLLEALPLPVGSAQADLVAASISQKATLAEREVRPRTQSTTQPNL